MVEPTTTAALAIYAAKKASGVVARVLGPAADELAEGFRQLTALKIKNVMKVIEKADTKRRHPDDGSIPTRAALKILEESAYADDEMVAEYLGGVLASSKSRFGRDDRGNTYAAMIARLSTYHLRMHYIIHSELARLICRHDSFSLFVRQDVRLNGSLFIPRDCYYPAMEFGEGEKPGEIIANALYQLNREGLIEYDMMGDPKYLAEIWTNSLGGDHKIFPSNGVVITPTVAGIELFMWAWEGATAGS